jgi:hypothetical protein
VPKISEAWSMVLVALIGLIGTVIGVLGGAAFQKEIKPIVSQVINVGDWRAPVREDDNERLTKAQARVTELERQLQRERERAQEASDVLDKARKTAADSEASVALERARVEQQARRAEEAEKIAATATAEVKSLSDQLGRAVASGRSEGTVVAPAGSVPSMPTASTRVLRVDILGIRVVGNDIEVVFRFLNLGDRNLPWMPLSPPTYLSDQNGNQFVLDVAGDRGQQMNLTPQIPLSRTYLFRGRTPPVGKVNAVLTNNFSIRDAQFLTMYGIAVSR